MPFVWSRERDARPSISARSVATIRRTLDRPAVPTGDPGADVRLSDDIALRLPWHISAYRAYIEGRTRFFDKQLLDGLLGSVRQVVVVGAGYDGRPLRFRQPGVTFFEIDQAATQRDKLRRLGRLGIAAGDVRFIGVDVRGGGIDRALASAGHDASLATLFLCEGLSAYLRLEDLVSWKPVPARNLG